MGGVVTSPLPKRRYVHIITPKTIKYDPIWKKSLCSN